MNKADLIAKISEKCMLTKKDAEKALEAITDSISEALSNDERVLILGFGTFENRHRSQREGINPQTGERITVQASTLPVFRPGKELRGKVNTR